MKKFFLTSILFFSLFLVLGVAAAEAQTSGVNQPPNTGINQPPNTGPNQPPTTGSNQPLSLNFKIDNPFKVGVGGNLYDLVKAIVNNIILPIGGVLCVLAFIYAGFLYVTAGGDSGQIKTAHSALLYASIGTAILLGSWVIASVIENTINQVIS